MTLQPDPFYKTLDLPFFAFPYSHRGIHVTCSIKPDTSAHWPGICFTVILPGNDVFKQLAAGNPRGHKESHKTSGTTTHIWKDHFFSSKTFGVARGSILANWLRKPDGLELERWNYYNNKHICSNGICTLLIQLDGVSTSFCELLARSSLLFFLSASQPC